MGTAKYDHPGYLADAGAAGTYHVGVWCPHGYPAHRPYRPRRQPGRCAPAAAHSDGGVSSPCPDDMEILSARFRAALAEGLLAASEGDFQESGCAWTPSPERPRWRRRSPPERGYPQAMWTTRRIGCAHLP